jgi:hypothetical protein
MGIGTDDLGKITQQTSVVTADGDRLGTIRQIYTSDTTGEPAWVTVRTGLFGTQESFVPLQDASFEGDDLRVPVGKKAVHDAPRVDTDGHLSVEEEDRLYRHYGLHDGVRTEGDQDHGQQGGGQQDVGRQDVGRQDVGGAVTGRDRDDDLAQRDVEGRDEVADRPDVEDGVQRDGSQHDENQHDENQQDDVTPGERTTRLRRYVVTERVVRTVEELPDEPGR